MNHFDPSVLAKLKNLCVRARFVVDGVMVGIHPSRAKGFSSDFEGHRQYSQGDDVRHIDWKTYGKFDRYFVKEYRETTNLRGYIFLDASSSMSYASDGWSKFDYGSTLAASLAYLMLKQQDSVGLITFSNKIEKMIPPKATPGHLFAILKELEERKPDGETSAGSVLQELAGSFKRKGLIILISDLLDKPEEVVRGLKQLRSRGSDVMVFHVLDRDELEFPFEEPTLFRDLEEDLKLLTDPRSVRSAYLKTLHSLIEGYREACAAHLVDYSLFNTSIGLDRALVRYLSWRTKFKAGP
ncbi:MAG: hypothetical protein A2162_02255 [Deltaproteobacteria bacterium RBG_13_52_11b]|nr:MAG: hypothetical protein A2162_02255 [Deltaproteobacteria bacterium RBG_13_52_11b]